MAKINKKPITYAGSGKTVNYEGGEAFEFHNDQEQLLHLTATCLFKEPKFYGELEETEEKIFALCERVDPEFMLQLAAYLRNELYLRTIPNVLLTYTSTRAEAKGTNLVTSYAPKIIKRADEITEVLAAYQTLFVPERTKENREPLRLPNSLKKAIAQSFPRFDEYQFAKYNRKGIVTFKDAIMLTHPSEPSKIIKKILDDKLKVPYTWETELSEGKGEDKKKTWEKLIDSEKLPYMALIRNLRNILDVGVSAKHIITVCGMIKNVEEIKKSKLFPFRFYQAYKEIQENDNPKTPHVLDALSIALDYSFMNIPHLKGTTFIACDTSGSMDTKLSERSSMSLKEVGLLLGVTVQQYTDDSLFGCFADEFGIYNIRKTAGIIDNLQNAWAWSSKLGGSTYGYKAIQHLNEKNIKVDRIIIFTDCQLYNERGWYSGDNTIKKEYANYKKNVNKNCKLYLVDLSTYGTVNFPESDRSVINITGWSERIFDFIKLHEVSPKEQINYIKRTY